MSTPRPILPGQIRGRRGLPGYGHIPHATSGGFVYSSARAKRRNKGAGRRLTDGSGAGPLTDLLIAAGRGDRGAFARLYDASAPTLFAVSLRTLRRRDLAEDVVQEAFLTIWRKARQYRPDRGHPLAWMVAIVRNRAIDRLRTERRAGGPPVAYEENTGTAPVAEPGEASIPGEVAQTIRTCIELLQINYRNSILFAYYYGLTHEELAARLKAPLGTVKTWVRRGLNQLKGCLEQ